MPSPSDKFKIPPTLLSPQVDASRLGFADTSELPPPDEPIREMDRQVVRTVMLGQLAALRDACQTLRAER